MVSKFVLAFCIMAIVAALDPPPSPAQPPVPSSEKHGSCEYHTCMPNPRCTGDKKKMVVQQWCYKWAGQMNYLFYCCERK